MMSMTSCNLLLASFGASSSTMRFHPLGKVKWYDSASLYCVCERMIRPERDPLSLLCHGLDSHQRPSHLCLSRFDRHEFAFCIFGHKQTSTHITHDRLARCRALCSGFPAPMTSVPSCCCWMPCQHHRPARCRVDSKRDLSASFVRSDSHGLPN